MPKGVYDREKARLKREAIKGFLAENNLADKPDLLSSTSIAAQETFETDDQIDLRLRERFDILEELTDSTIAGDARSLIVSGPPGLGKSFTIEQKLKELGDDEFSHVKGFIKRTGLYKLLYKHRFDGNVIVFDDCDAIFFDDDCLNMIKTVCDTTEERWVTYGAEMVLTDEDTGDLLPRTFEFRGSIIFITNLDFDTYIDKSHRLAPHMMALISRSHYIDLTMKTKRDYIVRIKQVINGGMLNYLPRAAREEIVDYIEVNQDTLRELSLRMALKLGDLHKTKGYRWKKIADITCRR